ncbi:Putative disease resistance protein RGA4 [Triticum urartu]|uniref:Putative disease resistance protein RGA4 n=1 Tax=Triticum urartu TaxID=4572 RepID=M7Z5J0_TRIUA|nr:Putative disease resistance protein RGA4 [Triticum urartu]
MAALVASTVVGPLVKILMDKASSYLLNQHKVMKGMKEQLESLERKLLAILDVITDIEEAASHRAGAKAWLEKAKKVVYQANEVFDEFRYEALRREAKKKGHYKELGFHVVKLFPTHNRFVFRKRMGKKLRKVVRVFDVLVTEMNAFHFERHQPPPEPNNWRQKDQDIFDPTEIVRRSRAKDSKKIVDILVGQAKNADLTVVPIVGMGGLGKTTLAQLVYNEPEIQKHFDMLIWVCVSDSFDVNSLAKSIVEAAPEKKHDGKEAVGSKKKMTPLDSLQNLVSGQRYLLVLDDVWTREILKWEQLKACLQHGGMGSAVLTTTRDEKRKEDRSGVLVSMVGEIVKRCMGSPLAATALGSVLRTKTSEEEWKAVSSRSSICTEETGILPILKLSYNDLPPHMKQCFAFCGIFPKDHEIDVDKLIQLWIAHGFLIPEEQVRLETIGKQIFKELASRKFFQDVKQVQATGIEIEYTDSYYSRTTCKIHDLMHDVALSVMEKECALATRELGKTELAATEEPSQSEWLTNSARHLFLSCYKPERRLNSSLEKSSPAIQTLVCNGYMQSSLQHLSKYSSLKALQLCTYKRSIPLKPKHLHYMRYLDLSRSLIRALPEDMSILYNLQTLDLSGCEYLEKLPRQMKYMTALRHLYTHGCPKLKSMPRDLGKLTSLQTLTCFVAGSGSNCSNVGELRNLNLGGYLNILHLENVTEDDAKAANLVKKELRYLALIWLHRWKHRRDETIFQGDARVLENLRPHDGLHAIEINSYGGTTFPTWLAVLQNIVEIHLWECRKLQWLFSSECDSSFTFPNLKELTLQGLVCLERWWEIANGGTQGEEIMFPLLEKLDINFCEKLTALPGQPTFPNLQKASIVGCPELTTVAESPKLSELEVEGREAELFLWVGKHMTSLTNLVLESLGDSTATTSVAAQHGLREVVNGQKKWNDQDFPLAGLVLRGFKVFHYPASLRKMDIRNCSKLESTFGMRLLLGQSASSILQGSSSILEVPSSSSPGAGAEHLEELQLKGCDGLTGVLHLPPSLKDLTIVCCNGLTSLESGSGVLPLLKSLSLKECNSLSSLLDGVQAYSSLHYLSISNCSELKTLPESLQQRLGSIPQVHIDAKYDDEIRELQKESWESQYGSCDAEFSQHK